MSHRGAHRIRIDSSERQAHHLETKNCPGFGCVVSVARVIYFCLNLKFFVRLFRNWKSFSFIKFWHKKIYKPIKSSKRATFFIRRFRTIFLLLWVIIFFESQTAPYIVIGGWWRPNWWWPPGRNFMVNQAEQLWAHGVTKVLLF